MCERYSTLWVRDGFGKQMEDNDADYNERQAQNCRKIETLSVKNPSDSRDQNNADARPDGISHSDGKRFKRKRKKIKGRGIGNNDNCRGEGA